MPRILSNFKQGLLKVLSLTMLLISLSGLFIFSAQPSYAATAENDQLTSDEKIDRAYQFRVGTGFLEEEKQASANANEKFDPTDSANVKSVKTSKDNDTDTSLGEKVQDLIQKVIGDD